MKIKLTLTIMLFFCLNLAAVGIRNAPFYKNLSDDVYFRVLTLPGDLKKGEIFLKDSLVIEVTDSYGFEDAVKQTYFTGAKVQLLLDKKVTPNDIGVEKNGAGAVVTSFGDTLVEIKENEAMLRFGIPAFKLAFFYACRIKKALGDNKEYMKEEFVKGYKELNRGDEYFANNFLEEAYLSYRKSWKRDRNNALVNYSMGAVAYHLEKYDEAMKFLEKSTELSEEFPPAYYMIARASIAAGDNRKAMVAAKMALKYNPGNNAYLDILETIQQSLLEKQGLSFEVDLSSLRNSLTSEVLDSTNEVSISQ